MVTNLSYLFVLFIFMTYLLVNFFYICNGTGVCLPSHRMESVYEDEGVTAHPKETCSLNS